MGYRTVDKPPKPEDLLRRFDVRNGAIMRMTFGCFYSKNGHDPHYHDHVNWPAPNYHPGPICQMKPPRDVFRWFEGNQLTGHPVQLDPIHLFEEGYSEAVVSYEDPEMAQYLDTTALIDSQDDNLVRVSVHANFPTFSDKPKEARFTLFIKKYNGTAIDAVCHGIVTVLPGSPCPTS